MNWSQTRRKRPLRGLAFCLAAIMMLQLAIVVPGTAASAAGTAMQQTNGYLDTIDLGNEASETAHGYKGEASSVITGFKGEKARVANPLAPVSRAGGDISFTMKVDPYLRNYLTIKFGGEDSNNDITSMVHVNGEQVGYLRHGDIDGLKSYYVNNRFYYYTTVLPLEATYGKETVEITISSMSLWGQMTAASKPLYNAYTHVQAYLDVVNETQGNIFTSGVSADTLRRDDGLTTAAKQLKIDAYASDMISRFNQYSNKVDSGTGGKLSIVRYEDELKFYASALKYDWSPANTPALKKAALNRIFKTIDNHVKDYYGNIRNVLRGGHQGDWGGYYGALGEALYIAEKWISDDDVYGKAAFEAFLDQPFSTGTTAGEFSLAGVDWEGGELTRREAWERVLKANFDFSRARLSYIYNQMLYTYEGAWEAQEGLRIIESEFYEGRERSERILLESLGIEPFLGEEVLVGPNGEELDLYHSLFKHDGGAVFTDDFVQVIGRGLAKSKLDSEGQVVRRQPYGEHYTGLTAAGLTRENSYVANYGEAANYLLTFFYKTYEHNKTDADKALNDRILKAALKNLDARGYIRYQSFDGGGNRTMKAEQATDERNQSLPGFDAYGGRIGTGMTMQFASLEMLMASDEERYVGAEWDEYWRYAREAVGYAQQQLFDNQLIENGDFGNTGTNSNWNYRIKDTYAYLTGGRAEVERFAGEQMAGVVLPHTNFDFYTAEELDELQVDPADYERFAWADVDNLYLSIKDGDFQLFGSFFYRLRGVAGNGRVHVMNDAYSHVLQIATNNRFGYEDVYLRPANPDVDYMGAQTDNANGAQLAHLGEVLPIAYQPGVGTVVRDGLESDTPYAGYPELQTSRYGKYFMIFNTTRNAYGNEQSFEVELPVDFTGNSVLDLVSGSQIPVVNGKITIPPMSAMALKLSSDMETQPLPYHVDFANALVGEGAVSLSWKMTSGGETYTVKRSESQNGPYVPIASGIAGLKYDDTTAQAGKVYYYKVAAVNGNGEGWDSWPVKADLTGVNRAAEGWLSSPIGSGGGMVTASDNAGKPSFSFTAVNGSGFKDGDDYNIYKRDMDDSLHYVYRPANGNSEIVAKLGEFEGEASGIMLRQDLGENTRYAYFGTNEEGKLVLRTRTRESFHQWSEQTVSPLNTPIQGFTADEYPYIKLTRHHSSQYVFAFVSKDGLKWEFAAKALALLPEGYYSGVTASDAASITVLEARRNPDDSVMPFIVQKDDQVTLEWSKPKQVIRVNVYRTADAAASAHDPVLKPGTLEPEQGSPWERVVADAYITGFFKDELRFGDAYYKLLAVRDDGTLLPFESVSTSADTLETLLAKAESYNSADYTRLSFYKYNLELARLKAAVAEPEADIVSLIDDIYAARELLQPINEVYLKTAFDAAQAEKLYAKVEVTPSMVTASAKIWSSSGGTGTPEQNGWLSFDGDITTGTDTQTSTGWIRVDLGEGSTSLVEGVRYHPRPCCTVRLNGGIIQGSNDNATWVNLHTISGVLANVSQWYSAPLSGSVGYRYYRYIDNHGGNTNMGELELYRETFDSTLLQYALDEGQYAIDAAIYTPESYAALEAAMLEAKAADSQADADREAAELLAALDSMTYIEGMPVLNRLEDATIIAGVPFKLEIEASNVADGETVSYALSEELPQGAEFDGESGAFVWTPGLDQGGIYPLTFTATAGDKSSSKAIKLTVVGAPDIDESRSAQITAKAPYTYSFSASDASQKPLTITVEGMPKGAVFNAAKRELTWTPGQADYGAYTILFKASNGSFTSTHSLNLQVKLSEIAPGSYTKGSYYAYRQAFLRIEAAMGQAGADKTALAAELSQAETMLQNAVTLYNADSKLTITPDMAVASHKAWGGVGTAEENGWKAFDGNATTSPDTEVQAGWVRIDFGAGEAPSFQVIKFLPRSGNHARMNGAVLEGSQDGTTYETIHTFSGVTGAIWSMVKLDEQKAYRFLRYKADYANVAELEFHKAVTDQTLLQLLVEQGNDVNLLYYTPESREGFEAALAASASVLGDGTAAQALIDEASDSLIAALDRLVAIDASQVNAVHLALSPASLKVGETLSVTVSARGLTDMYGYEIALSVDDRLLEFVSGEDMQSGFQWAPTVAGGTVTLIHSQVGAVPGLTGDQELYTLKFKAKQAGTASIQLTSVKIVDSRENANARDGYIGDGASVTIEQQGGGNTGEPEATLPPGNTGGNNGQPEANDGLTVVKVTVDQLRDAIKAAQGGIAKLKLNVDRNDKGMDISLPVAELREALKLGLRSIEVDAGIVVAAIHPAVLDKAAGAGAIELKLAVTAVKRSELPDPARAALRGDAYDLSLSIDGQPGHAVNLASVRLPYTLQAGESATGVIVYAISDTGKLSVVPNVVYDEESGTATFWMKESGRYAIGYKPVTFQDLAGVPWAQASIEALAARDIVFGVGDGQFNANGDVTRSEFITMLMRAFSLIDPSAEAGFVDAAQGEWYYSAVASAQQLGIVNGKGDQRFGVQDRISRQEMATILFRTLNVLQSKLESVKPTADFSDQGDIAGYAAGAIRELQAAGIVAGKGGGLFAPLEGATRAEAAAVIYRLLGAIHQ